VGQLEGEKRFRGRVRGKRKGSRAEEDGMGVVWTGGRVGKGADKKAKGGG